MLILLMILRTCIILVQDFFIGKSGDFFDINDDRNVTIVLL